MESIQKTALVFTIIGAITWGLIGIGAIIGLIMMIKEWNDE